MLVLQFCHVLCQSAQPGCDKPTDHTVHRRTAKKHSLNTTPASQCWQWRIHSFFFLCLKYDTLNTFPLLQHYNHASQLTYIFTSCPLHQVQYHMTENWPPCITALREKNMVSPPALVHLTWWCLSHFRSQDTRLHTSQVVQLYSFWGRKLTELH